MPPSGDDRAFPVRPRRLPTLSRLEVRERFSFLGVQAVPVPHAAGTVTNGGTGMSTTKGGTDISTGTDASVSVAHGTLACPVSVAAGRVPGFHPAVLRSGIPIACGPHAMAMPATATT
ncbi:hypothetical protein [Streptomyces sp. NPDC047706]|uniref:hypothetical protein n=1 Tax=Streptomyces sp. NPDC047706 TaxID=3365486 RepID=UPI00371C4CE7